MRSVMRRAALKMTAATGAGALAAGLMLAVAGPAAANPVHGGSGQAARAAGTPTRSRPVILPPRRLGSRPVITRGAHRIGALAAGRKVNIDVMLAPRTAVGLEDYAANVSSPGNSLYHHYLTVGQFASRFGPTNSAISTVKSFLRSAGLRPGTLAADHLLLNVTATAGQLAKAFALGFDQYRLPGGRIAFANTKAPLLSGAAARYVSAVIGLDNLSRARPLGLPRPAQHRAAQESAQPLTGGPQPCAAATTDAAYWSAYTADQLASAYNFSDLYATGDKGSGVTVGLLELEPNSTSDISAYQGCYGTDTTVNYFSEDGGVGTGSGSGEAALDIEDVIGLAPEATIDVYQAPNIFADMVYDYAQMIDNPAVKVISTSWGLCEPLMNTTILSDESTLFEQAATEGISVFAASGDDGSSDCFYDSSGPSTLAVDDPASQPYVTGVGGTSLTSIYGPVQSVWNNSSISDGAGGGGISKLYAMPSYQSSAPTDLNVVNSNSSGSPCGAATGSYCREVPDVSASADPERGYVIYYEGGWTAIGGTSAAAPLWAAFAVLTDASSTCDGTPVGFANPVLYQAAANNYSADFSDITSGNNDYTPARYTGGLYPAGTGYDMASGLGSPNGAKLPQALCTLVNGPTLTNPGGQETRVGAPASLQITASDSGGAALTYSATGLPPGMSIDSSSGLIAGTPTSAGAYAVTVSASVAGGASGSVSFAWLVDPVTLTITASSPTMTYGGPPPIITAIYNGFVNGDGPGSLTTPPTCSTNATSTSLVGPYQATCSGAADPNYTIFYIPGTVTVAPAPLTITASDATMTYGGPPPVVTASYSGFVNGDNPGSLTPGPTCSTTATPASAVGTYTDTCAGATDPNYTITYDPGTMTVGPAALTITPADATMTYGGPPPTITATYSGFVNGDEAGALTPGPTCSTTVTSASPAGTYPAGSSCAGAADPNYTISYDPGAVVVNKAPQSISWVGPLAGTAGTSAPLDATGGGSGNAVTFTLDILSEIGVCTVSGDTVTFNTAGTCVIDAKQAGNANYADATPVTQYITVIKATPTLTTTAGGTVVIGSSLSDSATLSGGASPTGTITFTLYNQGNTVVYTANVTVSGNGTYSTPAAGFSPTAVGTYRWIASYNGDNSNNAVTAAAENQSAAYGFGGFTAPLPKSTQQKSGSSIPVKFTLTNTAGKPISAAAAAALAAAGDVKATLSGPGITTVSAVCTWSTNLFQCNIKTPSGLTTGSAYQITAVENVTGTFITAPAVSKATTPNPETVYFK